MTDPVTTVRRGSLRTWWEQPFEYGTTTRLLRDRGLLTFYRAILITGLMLYGVASAISGYWFVALGLGRSNGTVVAVMATIAATVALAYLAIRPLPAENVARYTILVSDVVIVVFVLWFKDVYLAMPALAFLGANGTYLVVHHDMRTMLVHSVFSLFAMITVAATCVWVCNIEPGLVIVRFSVLAPIVVGVPLALLPLIMVMRSDAAESLRDELTGLFNRRGLSVKTEELAEIDGPVTVVVVDVDRFKAINDRFGHRTGDEVLIAIADAMRATVDDDGIVARTGGEEFALVAAGDNVDGHHLADQIHQRIWASTPRTRVTVSVGVATSHASLGFGHLFEVADQAMYRAKRMGGDRTVIV